MRKLSAAVVGVAVIAFAVSAMAFGVGDLKKATKDVGSSAAISAVNKDIAKKTSKCTFKPNTTTITGCKIGDITSALQAARTALETSNLANDVDIHFETYAPEKKYNLARDRYNALKAEITSKGVTYWDYFGSYKTSNATPNNLRIWLTK